MQYVRNKDHQHLKWRQQKSRISYPDCQEAQDKQRAQYLLKPRSKWKMHRRLKRIRSQNVQIRLPMHEWPKSWSSMEDPVVPLERNLYGPPLAGLLWKRQCEKLLLKYSWENVSNWECLFAHREKGFFLSVYVDDIKLAGKKQNINPMWKVSTKQRSWFGRTNIFPWSCILGMYSKTMRNKQRYCWQLQNYVWLHNVRRSNWKITMLGKSEYLFVVLWHGRSCQDVCGTIWWVSKIRRRNISTKYLLHASMTTTSKKKKWNLLENCHMYALKLFWNAETWHVLEDPIFYGQWTSLHDRSQNGPKLVTNDDLVWSLTFSIHVTTNSIVMWW